MDTKESPTPTGKSSTDGNERWQTLLRGCMVAMALCAFLTLLALWLVQHIEPTNLIMVYLLAVMLVALFYGRWPSVFSAVINVLSFDLFFVQPLGSLAVSDLQYLVTFAVMLIVGLTVGNLTAGVRHQTHIARAGERRARLLYEMSSALGQALTQPEIVATALHFIDKALTARSRIFLQQDNMIVDMTPDASDGGLVVDLATVRWSIDRDKPAGLGTDTLPGMSYRLCPLHIDRQRFGVLAIKPRWSKEWLLPEQQRLLETCALLTSSALERFALAESAEKARLATEGERLRNAVLSALSHDLRTPLTVLSGQAENLALDLADINSPYVRQADDIHQQALDTARLVNNLLDMARLGAGGMIFHPSWQSLEEMIGSALRTMRGSLSRSHVRVDLPDPALLVECDSTLMERVFINLLENAIKYAGPDAGILVRAVTRPGWLEVSVADTGPGIPPGKEVVIFEKFVRGDRESATPGVGLGLAICRAIIEIHQGRIWADNTPSGGACFHFTLPLTAPPELAQTEET